MGLWSAHRDRAIASPTAATVCTDARPGGLLTRPRARSTPSTWRRATWRGVSPPPFPVTGPLLAGFTGKQRAVLRPEETVVYDPEHGHVAGRPRPASRSRPDRVSWTQRSTALYVSDDTLAAYNPGRDGSLALLSAQRSIRSSRSASISASVSPYARV